MVSSQFIAPALVESLFTIFPKNVIMYQTKLFSLTTIVLFLLAALACSCTSDGSENSSKRATDGNEFGDPKRLKAYQVKVKGEGEEPEFDVMGCSSIADEPCFCVDNGGGTVLSSVVKNCLPQGTASGITVRVVAYPAGQSPVTLSASSSNPTSLAHDQAKAFSFSSGTTLDALDSVQFNIQFTVAGTVQSELLTAKTACNRCN